MSNMIRRRTFVERLGLGIGAALLAPIAATLHKEALGATVPRKRFLVWVTGNGLNPELHLSPNESAVCKTRSDGSQVCDYSQPQLPGLREFTWPASIDALKSYRARMLLVDGLSCFDGGQHSAGLTALTAMGNGGIEGQGEAKGPSIENVIAGGIGKDTQLRSVLWGVSSYYGEQQSMIFASGAGRPEPHILSPKLLFKTVFGNVMTNATGVVNTGLLKQRVVMDSLRGDIKRLSSALAGQERRKLDDYLSALESFDARSRIMPTKTCTPPAEPKAYSGEVAPAAPVEDVLELMNEISTIGLLCGITNVVGVGVGVGPTHGTFPRWYRLGAQFPDAIDKSEKDRTYLEGGGHNWTYKPQMDVIHNFQAGLLAKTFDTLSQVKEGDASIFDNMVAVYLSDNAEHHHSDHLRWAAYTVGNAGGALKADGRFLRYPLRGRAGNRSLGDFFCAISTACGVPMSTFGKGGPEPVSGPLPELLT